MSRFRFLLIGLVLLMLATTVTQAQTSVVGYVNTGALNVRSIPSPTNNVPISIIYEWQAMIIIGRTADLSWYQIQLNSYSTGWVRSRYITVTQGNAAMLPITDGSQSNCGGLPCPVLPPLYPTPTPIPQPPSMPPVYQDGQYATGYVNTGALNIRAIPADLNSTIQQVVYYGTDVIVIGRNAALTWYQVRLTDNTTGWVNSNYITVTAGDTRTLPIVDVTCTGMNCRSDAVVTSAYVNTYALNVRYVPSPYWNIPIRVIHRNTAMTLIGRNRDSTWLNIRLADGTTGWVRSTYVTLIQGTVRGLPVTG